MAFRRKILITILIIAGFDTVASMISRSFHYDFSSFAWGSFLIYLAIGYWGARRCGVKYGMSLGALAGLVDSTIGWFISRMIGPFIEMPIPTLTPAVVAPAIVAVTAMGLMFGLIGAGVCKVFGQAKPIAA
jgi:thiamine transporter ThiT